MFDRDPEELLKLPTPDVEYVNPPYAVEPGVRRGLVAVARAMRRFAQGWESSRHEIRELYDCGDAVVAAVDWHICGPEKRPGVSTAGSHGSSGARISTRLSRPRASRIRPLPLSSC